MPIVEIEVCQTRPPEQVSAFVEAVYQAQLITHKLPADGKQIRYVEHKPEHFPVPPGKTTFVEYQFLPGRSLEAKRKLYQGIVQRFRVLAIEPSDIIIVLHEPPLENWGIRGLASSEVKLGVNLDV